MRHTTRLKPSFFNRRFLNEKDLPRFHFRNYKDFAHLNHDAMAGQKDAWPQRLACKTFVGTRRHSCGTERSQWIHM